MLPIAWFICSGSLMWEPEQGCVAKWVCDTLPLCESVRYGSTQQCVYVCVFVTCSCVKLSGMDGSAQPNLSALVVWVERKASLGQFPGRNWSCSLSTHLPANAMVLCTHTPCAGTRTLCGTAPDQETTPPPPTGSMLASACNCK